MMAITRGYCDPSLTMLLEDLVVMVVLSHPVSEKCVRCSPSRVGRDPPMPLRKTTDTRHLKQNGRGTYVVWHAVTDLPILRVLLVIDLLHK